ncbi:MAG: DUF721 domain-containing protein [Candidatus Bipolaricaulaceae bacterium]
MNSPFWLEALAKSWGKGWEEQEAVWRWREVVGGGLSKLARPLYVERGVLHLAVPSPVVANELRLWEEEIISRLANMAPKSGVKELRFRIVSEAKPAQEIKAEPGAKEVRRAEALIPENLPNPLRTKILRLLAQVLSQEESILARGGRRCRRCGVAFLGDGEECPLCRLLP